MYDFKGFRIFLNSLHAKLLTYEGALEWLVGVSYYRIGYMEECFFWVLFLLVLLYLLLFIPIKAHNFSIVATEIFDDFT